MHMYMPQHVCGKLALSSHYVGSGDLTQVIDLGGKYLYLLSYLAGTIFF